MQLTSTCYVQVFGLALLASTIVSLPIFQVDLKFTAWTMLTIIFMIIYEGFAITVRFVNLSFVNTFSTVFFRLVGLLILWQIAKLIYSFVMACRMQVLISALLYQC